MGFKKTNYQGCNKLFWHWLIFDLRKSIIYKRKSDLYTKKLFGKKALKLIYKSLIPTFYWLFNYIPDELTNGGGGQKDAPPKNLLHMSYNDETLNPKAI